MPTLNPFVDIDDMETTPMPSIPPSDTDHPSPPLNPDVTLSSHDTLPNNVTQFQHQHDDTHSNLSLPESPLKDNRFLKELESHLGKAFEPLHKTRRPTARVAHAYRTASASSFIDTPEPMTYAEAMNGPEASEWKNSVEQEFKSWIANGVAELVDANTVPPVAKLIQGRPVFKRKINELGEVVRYKCRGVAKGYTQRPGIDFHECKSPVIRQCSVRTLLTIAATHDLELVHGDVDTAFLVPTLKEAFYLQPIDGMNVPKGKVLKLLKCIYGLKQASREWYIHFVNILQSLGFQPTVSDPCILTKNVEGNPYYIGIYVDDFIVTGKERDVIENIFDQLETYLSIKRLGDLSWILGMRVTRDRPNQVLYLDQTTYINSLIRKFQLQEANPTLTPHTKQFHFAGSLHGRAFFKRYNTVRVRRRGEICKVRLAFNSLSGSERVQVIGHLKWEDEG
jgi:hypothetical protein